jgi:hypothetical protein
MFLNKKYRDLLNILTVTTFYLLEMDLVLKKLLLSTKIFYLVETICNESCCHSRDKHMSHRIASQSLWLQILAFAPDRSLGIKGAIDKVFVRFRQPDSMCAVGKSMSPVR